MTISAGGSSEPWATLQKAPIFSSLILSAPKTSHLSPTSAAIFFARSARIVGVMRFEGSLTRSRTKFCDSPMMRASSKRLCSLAWSPRATTVSVSIF